MRTRKVVVSKIRERGLRIIPAAALAVSLGMLALGGCSSSTAAPPEEAALAKTELHFDINKCEMIEPGLYKCPAADKAICNPDYNGQAECVRIGPKGSVFVQSGFAK
jgi:hypothetical protein